MAWPTSSNLPLRTSTRVKGASRLFSYLAPDPERISIRRLDSIVTDLGLTSIRFLKIDVEGFELNVLKGAHETLRRSNPFILFEYSEMWELAGSDWRECFELLVEEHGYSLFQVEADQFQRPVLRHIVRSASIEAETCTDNSRLPQSHDTRA